MLYGNVPIYQTRYKRHFFLWNRFSETNGGRERSEFVCVLKIELFPISFPTFSLSDLSY